MKDFINQMLPRALMILSLMSSLQAVQLESLQKTAGMVVDSANQVGAHGHKNMQNMMKMAGLRYDLTENQTIHIIIIVAVLVIVLVIVMIMFCYCCKDDFESKKDTDKK